VLRCSKCEVYGHETHECHNWNASFLTNENLKNYILYLKRKEERTLKRLEKLKEARQEQKDKQTPRERETQERRERKKRKRDRTLSWIRSYHLSWHYTSQVHISLLYIVGNVHFLHLTKTVWNTLSFYLHNI